MAPGEIAQGLARAAARRRQPRDIDMSDDPETARQIAELARDDRPLLVLDVDEVVLEFIRPFTGYLGTLGLELQPDSFRLHGNIVDQRDAGGSAERTRLGTDRGLLPRPGRLADRACGRGRSRGRRWPTMPRSCC